MNLHMTIFLISLIHDPIPYPMIQDVLLENWPARCKCKGEMDDNVIIIDIFTCSEEKLQDQLTRTMSMINEHSGEDEIGGRQAEKKRLTQVTPLADGRLYIP